MKLFVAILLAFQISTGFSQIDFESDCGKAQLFSEITSQINVLNQDFDFQLRFWEHGGLMLPQQHRLFVMTFKKSKWNCESFQFIYHRKKDYKILRKKINVISCDSLWSNLVANKILVLPDMELLRKDFYNIIEPKIKQQTAKQSEIGKDIVWRNMIEEVEIVGAGVNKRSIIIADGVSYSIELIKGNKYKRIEYHCPVSYGNFYKHIVELRYMTNIVKYLYKIMGIDETPC